MMMNSVDGAPGVLCVRQPRSSRMHCAFLDMNHLEKCYRMGAEIDEMTRDRHGDQAYLGMVISVRGSVVDVSFDDHFPSIYSVLHAGEESRVVIEVLAHSDAAPGSRHCTDTGARIGVRHGCGLLTVPTSVKAIVPLLAHIQVESEVRRPPVRPTRAASTSAAPA